MATIYVLYLGGMPYLMGLLLRMLAILHNKNNEKMIVDFWELHLLNPNSDKPNKLHYFPL